MKLSTTIRQKFASQLLRASIRRLREQEGQSLVETALSIVVMLGLIFGVILACCGVYSLHYLANAAHEATRYAIVRGGDWTTTCDGTGAAGSGYSSSMCQASPQDVANYVANRNFPGINITPGDVCVEYSSSVPSTASTSCSASSTPNAAGDVVQVTITYPYSFNLPSLSPPFVRSYTWHLASTSQMIITQ